MLLGGELLRFVPLPTVPFFQKRRASQIAHIMKTLDIQYRQAQSVNIDLGMLDIAEIFHKLVNKNEIVKSRKSPPLSEPEALPPGQKPLWGGA